MECFGTTDFDNNSRLITLSAIIISGLHCTLKRICALSWTITKNHCVMHGQQNVKKTHSLILMMLCDVTVRLWKEIHESKM